MMLRAMTTRKAPYGDYVLCDEKLDECWAWCRSLESAHLNRRSSLLFTTLPGPILRLS
jgi:hypothetical protein